MQSYNEKLIALDEFIKNTIIDETGVSTLNMDGIVNVNSYVNSKYKILWILKEPIERSGDGWDMREALSKLSMDNYNDWRKTFAKIIYTSYGILNDFILWDGQDYIHANPVMKEILNSVAYINLKKLPNTNNSFTSNDLEIKSAYQKYKALILSQIEMFDPQIIIGGYTLQYILSDLGQDVNEMEKYGTAKFIIDKSTQRLFINAYHPSYWTIKEQEYCDDIITIAKNWAFRSK